MKISISYNLSFLLLAKIFYLYIPSAAFKSIPRTRSSNEMPDDEKIFSIFRMQRLESKSMLTIYFRDAFNFSYLNHYKSTSVSRSACIWLAFRSSFYFVNWIVSTYHKVLFPFNFIFHFHCSFIVHHFNDILNVICLFALDLLVTTIHIGCHIYFCHTNPLKIVFTSIISIGPRAGHIHHKMIEKCAMQKKGRK